MRMLGIIMAYNDEDCIHNAIKCLLKANHEVHVFNHGSTDSTRNVILNYPVTLIDLNRNRWPNFTKNGQDNVHYAVTKHIQKKLFYLLFLYIFYMLQSNHLLDMYCL